MKEFIPLHANILVEEIKEENKFGIPSESMSFKAKVLKVGPMVPKEVKVDDVVYLSNYCGTKYGDLLIIQPHDVMGKEV